MGLRAAAVTGQVVVLLQEIILDEVETTLGPDQTLQVITSRACVFPAANPDEDTNEETGFFLRWDLSTTHRSLGIADRRNVAQPTKPRPRKP